MWTYAITTATTSGFTARATKKSGQYINFTIDIDQNGNVTYSSRNRYPP